MARGNIIRTRTSIKHDIRTIAVMSSESNSLLIQPSFISSLSSHHLPVLRPCIYFVELLVIRYCLLVNVKVILMKHNTCNDIKHHYTINRKTASLTFCNKSPPSLWPSEILNLQRATFLSESFCQVIGLVHSKFRKASSVLIDSYDNLL